MARRRPLAVERPGVEGSVPDWLVRFVYADWVDLAEQVPVWVATNSEPGAVPRWRGIRARRRWSDAGHAWLAERGRPRDWFALVHPDTARNCGLRLRRD